MRPLHVVERMLHGAKTNSRSCHARRAGQPCAIGRRHAPGAAQAPSRNPALAPMTRRHVVKGIAERDTEGRYLARCYADLLRLPLVVLRSSRLRLKLALDALQLIVGAILEVD